MWIYFRHCVRTADCPLVLSSHSKCVNPPLPLSLHHWPSSHPSARAWTYLCYCVHAADRPCAVSSHRMCVNPSLPTCSHCWPSSCNLISQLVRECTFATVHAADRPFVISSRSSCVNPPLLLCLHSWLQSHPTARAWIYIYHRVRTADRPFGTYTSSHSKCVNIPLLLFLHCWLSIRNLIPQLVREYTFVTAFAPMTVRSWSHFTASVWTHLSCWVRTIDRLFMISSRSLCVHPPLPPRSHLWASVCNLIPQDVREPHSLTVFVPLTLRLQYHPTDRAWIHLCHCVYAVDPPSTVSNLIP
jgi:hypothetical protein